MTKILKKIKFSFLKKKPEFDINSLDKIIDLMYEKSDIGNVFEIAKKQLEIIKNNCGDVMSKKVKYNLIEKINVSEKFETKFKKEDLIILKRNLINYDSN
jgi:hypothetical protein